MKALSESLVIVNSHLEQPEEAMRLSKLLNVPLLESSDLDSLTTDSRYILYVQPDSISLLSQEPHKSSPFKIDFTSNAYLTRLKTSGKHQPLAKSIGLNKRKTSDNTVSVLDATAGLARDALTLAYLGCHVCMMESSPLLSVFLRQALLEAKNHPMFKDWLYERVEFLERNSIEYLSMPLNARPDVIYLDPMFPERKKSAKVKKEMQLLQQLVEPDENNINNEQLLNVALNQAQGRVVVKRPRHAPTLTALKPNHNILAPSLRYDIYMV